jgi:hypothetical protein
MIRVIGDVSCKYGDVRILLVEIHELILPREKEGEVDWIVSL